MPLDLLRLVTPEDRRGRDARKGEAAIETAAQKDATAARLAQENGEAGAFEPCTEASKVATAGVTIDWDTYSEELAALVRSDPELRDAALGAARIEADPYLDEPELTGWVLAAAEKKWAETLANYMKLEDKAASIVTWASGGTGLLATGLALGVADGRLPPVVAVAFLPALFMAALATVSAFGARAGKWLYPTPDVETALAHVRSRGPLAQTSILGEWHMANTRLAKVSTDRSLAVLDALWYGAWTATLLVVPLLVAVCLKCGPRPD